MIFRVVLVLAALSVARPARAQLALELGQCGSLAAAPLREHLSLELSTLGLESVEAQLRLVCTGSQVIVELTQASGARYPVEVRVELHGTAKAERERLVALAASELIAQADRATRAAAVGTEHTATQPRQPTRDDLEGANDRAPRDASARPGPHELSVAATTAIAGSSHVPLWGAALGARFGLVPRWTLLLDTRFERGRASLSPANVRWSSLTGFIGAAASTSASRYQLSLGLGARAGWLALDADAPAPNDGQSMTAPWAGIALPARAALLLGERVRPFIGCEVGYVFLPVRGRLSDGQLLVAQRGPWISGSIGLGVSL